MQPDIRVDSCRADAVLNDRETLERPSPHTHKISRLEYVALVRAFELVKMLAFVGNVDHSKFFR